MSEPLDFFALGFRRPEPQPVPDCAECRQLVRKRHAAREVADFSSVSDQNVLLRKHQKKKH